MDRVSVIIPTYNSERIIGECLESLRSYSLNYNLDMEIIVVDAGSEDRTYISAKDLSDKFIVSPKASRGKARNIGVEASKNEYLVFLDSDCVITKSWIQYLRSLPHLANNVLVSGPAILDNSNSFVGNVIKEMTHV